MTNQATTPALDLDLSGYVYGCSCGELYQEIDHAVTCRKCRTYSLGGRCLYVTDTRTGSIVWGRLPTDEERAEYVADMAREAEEPRRWIQEREAELAREESEAQADLEISSRYSSAQLSLEAQYDMQEDLELGNCRRW